jgi:cytochrome c-type biogenesis protein CcmE
MIKQVNSFLLLLVTLIATTGAAQNLRAPEYFLLPRELPYYEKRTTTKDFHMFGFIEADSIVFAQGQWSFDVTDGFATISAVTDMYLDDNFPKDNDPVLIGGIMSNAVFVAESLLVVNSESSCDYLPEGLVVELNAVGFEMRCPTEND